MAKGVAPIEIMPAAELKPLLVLSKRQAVGCAIGMTRDKQGLVLLHRRKKPRKLMAELLRQVKAAGADLDRTTMRFGRATVDGASDSSTVHFTVNKHAPDTLRVKLLERLRPVGFQHCDIAVDEELEKESYDGGDEDDTAEAPHHGGAAAPDARGPASPALADGAAPAAQADLGNEPPDDTGGANTTPTPAEPAQPDAEAAPAAGTGAANGQAVADPAAVRTRLAALARRAATALATDPAGTDAIRSAAAQARQALASGSTAAAGQAADALERLLPAGSASGGSAQPGTRSSGSVAHGAAADMPDIGSGRAAEAGGGGVAVAASAATRHPPGSPVFAKGQAAWTAVRSKLQADIDAAMKGMVASYGNDDPRVRTILDRVEPVMKQLDDSLAVKLGEVAGNKGPEAHAGLVREAEQIIGRYRAFVDGEPMIAGLDGNPFHPMAVRKTMDTALAALSKVVETAT